MKQLTFSRQTSLLNVQWIPVKDGNDTGRAIFDNHYSRRHYRDGRKPKLYVGPGEKIVLITPDAGAVFIWRKFKDDAIPPQHGVNCAAFRREFGSVVASKMIRAAEHFAWERWPGERLYTYVDTKKTRHKRDPGRCFRKAGWKPCGHTKSGQLILEKLPEWELKP
jgi:hypothetical protein